jgi:hypothetical protein
MAPKLELLKKCSRRWSSRWLDGDWDVGLVEKGYDSRRTDSGPAVQQEEKTVRSVAQSGSALAWGARGPEFKSRRSDQLNQMHIPSARLILWRRGIGVLSLAWHSLATEERAIDPK